jgi:hypothetical protein
VVAGAVHGRREAQAHGADAAVDELEREVLAAARGDPGDELDLGCPGQALDLVAELAQERVVAGVARPPPDLAAGIINPP